MKRRFSLLFVGFLIANFVVIVVAYYRKCYESISLCLITNIEDIENQHSWNSNCRLNQSLAADWCERKSSSLVIITNATVQSAVTEFISDSAARFESDVITYGNRFLQYDWRWINGNIYRDSYSGYEYRYAYLYVSVDRTVVSFYGHATSRKKFICSYNLDYYYYRCAYGFETLNMTCYKIRNEQVTWYDARRRCLTEEYCELAIFENGLPQLTSKQGLIEQYWIGLRKESWNWRNGQTYEEVKYSNWNDRSPRNEGGNCLCLQVPSGKWANCSCNRNYRYICQQAYSSSLSSSKETSATIRTTRPSTIPATLPTTATKLPTTTTKLTTTTTKLTTITTKASTTPSKATITTPTSSPFHSTLAPGDDLSNKASGEPANPSDNSGVILALGIVGACLLILIGLIVAIVVIKNRRSRSGGVGPRQQDYPPQHIYEAGAPNNVYAIVVPNTSESARFPSERTQGEIVYAELDLAPTEKRTQRTSTPGKTPNQIFHHPAPKGSKRGRTAAPESEYANSIPLESVYDNIAPS